MSFATKTVMISGHTITLRGLSEDDPYFAAVGDNYEPAFQELCHYLLPDDSICIDIGANIGVKALLLSRMVSAGHVVAIEAAPTVADCLALNVAANAADNVTVERTAIGDTSGTTKFIDASAFGHMSDHGVDVPLTTLPALIERLGLSRVDFIKIDVEGFEYPILRNSLNVINRFESLVMFELNAWCQIAYGDTDLKEFVQWILANFDHVFVLEPDGTGETLLDPVGKNEWERLLHKNLVEDHCVTDLLVTNAPRRLVPSAASMVRRLNAITAEHGAITRERDAAINERDMIRGERDAILGSTSWAVTAPLRKLGKSLGLRIR